MNRILLIAFLFFSYASPGQNVTEGQFAADTENYANVDAVLKKSHFVRIAFYNLENLYDPYDDTTKLDDEFISGGTKRWNFSRFLAKLNHLAKTFIAVGGWEPPAIIGMCEVENRYVLNKLIYETPLKKYQYRFIHYESPDVRGIDVALLYRPCVFSPVYSGIIRIRFPSDSLVRTRDILYVKGVLNRMDTVHIFVNHWPSRRGGFTESAPKRMFAALTLRSALDSLITNRGIPQIIIMGDFNDEPDQPSIREGLQAEPFSAHTRNTGLVNLMLPLMNKANEGTHKFQGKWAILDQFMVSGNFFLMGKGLQTSPESVQIFRSAFLLEEDERYLGGKPSRTYAGPRYTGGFSDHLPIYMDVWKKER